VASPIPDEAPVTSAILFFMVFPFYLMTLLSAWSAIEYDAHHIQWQKNEQIAVATCLS
jgi:hypothetical protein